MYILLLILTTANGATQTTINFNDKVSCEYAMEVIQDNLLLDTKKSYNTMCLPYKRLKP